MFKPDRVFSQRNDVTGKLEWFFQAREGIIGPYETREVTERMLAEFIARCIANRDDGGRDKKAGSSLSLAPMDQATIAFEPGKPKKGKDNVV